VADTLKIEIGRNTAKLVLRCFRLYYLRFGWKLRPDDEQALYRFLKPIKEWVDHGPPITNIWVQVKKSEDEDTLEREAKEG
jgi:hypothetical protein